MQNIDQLRDCLQVKEVCKMLGVCRDTLRSWERKGKLVPYRHPGNNYRYYSQKMIDDFLNLKKLEDVVDAQYYIKNKNFVDKLREALDQSKD